MNQYKVTIENGSKILIKIIVALFVVAITGWFLIYPAVIQRHCTLLTVRLETPPDDIVVFLDMVNACKGLYGLKE